LPAGGRVRGCDIHIDGGNVVASVSTAILTDKVYRENPGRHCGRLKADLAGVLHAEVG
jgi:hypothetical protein